ncbi:uncharacterized protein LOC130700265 [Daphnia carinata]|uniref:uncharacterized protein LOC130700265 n=1 Tax=Daphnia carinata TaxID=120202 RepID=UPI00257BB1FB|nr:uncharacterized protein LOC130700265 [Daphnia carinata]
MNKAILVFLFLAMVGSAFSRPQQNPFRPGGNFQFGGNRPAGAFPGQTLFNGGNAAGFGSGAVQPGGGQVIGTGTGIANPGPGGFGVALGVGGAVASPVGNFALGQGESISIGK